MSKRYDMQRLTDILEQEGLVAKGHKSMKDMWLSLQFKRGQGMQQVPRRL